MREGLLVSATTERVRLAVFAILAVVLLVLAAGCSSMTLEPNIFLATRSDKSTTVWSSDKNFPFSGSTASGTYSLGFVLGKETKTVVYLPLSRKDLPPNVDAELIDKIYLEIPLWIRSQENGSVTFGVYWILEDWRQHAGTPSGIVPLQVPDDEDTLLINLISHWPLSTEADPKFTFTLTYDPTPKKIMVGPPYSQPSHPSYPEQILRLDLTELAKGWLREEPNYGILIQPLPNQYVPSETYWWQQKDKKPALVFVFRTPADHSENTPTSGSWQGSTALYSPRTAGFPYYQFNG